MLSAALAFGTLLAAANAQQVGTLTPEVHPPLTVSKCTASGCTTSTQSIVLDSNWRWLHTLTGSTNCYTGNTWNTAVCSTNVQCAANCALEGASYSSIYGITTTGNALRLNFVTKAAGTNVGSRTYLMAAGSETQYELLKLLGQEFTFDVDVSNLPCGLNGALYFSEMDQDGGVAKYPTNKAGAKYGTGYCDAQCPRDLKFISGQANVEGWGASSNDVNAGFGNYGSCCTEMDIWEANSISTAYTPHPCDVSGQTRCTGKDCGVGDRYASLCDADGCDFNSYRMGDTSFYGPGKTLDTTKKLTVVTQFISSDGTGAGDLVEIKRFYVQNGVTYANSQSQYPTVPGNSITDEFCANQKAAFDDQNIHLAKGGLKKMGQALKNGMVLVMSIWDDHSANMLWLDAPYPPTKDASEPGVSRGSCSRDSGNPVDVERDHPDASVTYSNIKWGPLGSTFQPPTGPGPVSSSRVSTSTRAPTSTIRSSTSTRPASTTVRPSSTSTSTRAPTSTPATGGGTAPHWGQCGGNGWTGPTVCASPYTCIANGPWYSQCL